MILHCRDRQLDLSAPQVMGVLNVTPDSFSDGGRFIDVDAAVSQAHAMVIAGATIVDVGGESTRPGADPVGAQAEMDRVLPVIERIYAELEVILSVDTSKPEVMKAAVQAGAHMINDVRALREDGALEAASGSDAAVCLMHMQGEPRTMQREPSYEEVVSEVVGFLRERAGEARSAGVDHGRIVVDPGFGFGKTLQHNLDLLAGIDRLVDLGYPVLIGLSRKSMFGKLLDRDTDERLAASVAAAALGVRSGAHIVRAHDVAETVDAVRLAHAVREARGADHD